VVLVANAGAFPSATAAVERYQIQRIAAMGSPVLFRRWWS
jgi:hypothetical protein